MKYILDFDRVLFDTDAFIERLNSEGLGDMPRGQELLDGIEEKKIDWTEFVYEEALEFLMENGRDCLVLSSYYSRKREDNSEEESTLEFFQNEKVKRSGIAELVSEVHIVGREKEEKLREMYDRYGDVVYFDDEKIHVEHAHQIGYRAVWMRGKKEQRAFGHEKAPVITEFPQVGTFSEFVEQRKAWKKKE